ncbi:MAG: hypothetical protein DRN15_10825 [Thermoprotei archaeon]|nr:MAG: hypothetical protein DRN15_10825 [Thermoprotei archaeon]
MVKVEDLLRLEDLLLLRHTLEAYNDALIKVFRLMNAHVFLWIKYPPNIEEFKIYLPEAKRKKLLELIDKLEYHKESIDNIMRKMLSELDEAIEEYHSRIKKTLKDSEGSGHG